MTKCIRCGVSVDGQHKNCPLCGRRLDNKGGGKTEYPAYGQSYRRIKTFTLYKLYLFLTISAILISTTVNVMTLPTDPVFWSGIVTCALLYTLITIRNTIISKRHIGAKILVQFISLAVFMFVIDICNGFSKWSTNYVIPFLIVVSTVIITIIALTKKSLWLDYAGYLFAMFFISLCPIVLFVFRLATVIWTGVMAVLYSVLTIIGLIIFSDEKFKNETRKRFHF
ncbi:hypothetical protein AGMMS49975_10990 [Clostridia bacterium]|nr:hypothetical protein AGMMS49975_10990 [Clostridia bacterium]GHU78343.1 hypothetical protein FACS1894188_13380 [Clostridia bacterium]